MNTFEDLKKFVIEKSFVRKEPTRETRIQDDLRIYGDDAVEFIVAYGQAFNVDVTKFMAADYFDPEGDKILPAIIRTLTLKQKRPRKILTVGHLEKGIKEGRLDESVINEN